MEIINYELDPFKDSHGEKNTITVFYWEEIRKKIELIFFQKDKLYLKQNSYLFQIDNPINDIYIDNFPRGFDGNSGKINPTLVGVINIFNEEVKKNPSKETLIAIFKEYIRDEEIYLKRNDDNMYFTFPFKEIYIERFEKYHQNLYKMPNGDSLIIELIKNEIKVTKKALERIHGGYDYYEKIIKSNALNEYLNFLYEDALNFQKNIVLNINGSDFYSLKDELRLNYSGEFYSPLSEVNLFKITKAATNGYKITQDEIYNVIKLMHGKPIRDKLKFEFISEQKVIKKIFTSIRFESDKIRKENGLQKISLKDFCYYLIENIELLKDKNPDNFYKNFSKG